MAVSSYPELTKYSHDRWQELRAALELLGVPLFSAYGPGYDDDTDRYCTWINCTSDSRWSGPDEEKLEAPTKEALMELCYKRAIEIAAARAPQ